VHLEHGVGIYRGIEKIFVRESTVEVAVIEYEGGDKIERTLVSRGSRSSAIGPPRT